MEELNASILAGMARWIWVWAYGVWDETILEVGGYVSAIPDTETVALASWDVPRSLHWVGAPETPPAAFEAARALAGIYLHGAQYQLADLFELAMHQATPDPGHYRGTMESDAWASHTFNFGYALAMVAINDRDDVVTEMGRFDPAVIRHLVHVTPFAVTFDGASRLLSWTGGGGESGSLGGGRRIALRFEIRGLLMDGATEEGWESEEDQSNGIESYEDAVAFLLDHAIGSVVPLERRGNPDAPAIDYRAPFGPPTEDGETTALVYRLENFTDQELRDIEEIVVDSAARSLELPTVLNWRGQPEPTWGREVTWGRLIFVNVGRQEDSTFVLGIPGNDLLIHADHFGDAFDEAIDWIAEHRPGLVVDDEVQAEFNRLLEEARVAGADTDDDDFVERAMRESEDGTVSGGNAGTHIDRDSLWQMYEDPTLERIREIAHHWRR